MKLKLRTIIIIPVFAALSACASTPDPAEVCSAEWIAPRATKAVAKIEKRAKSSIKTLGKVSESWASGKTPSFLQMLALRNAMKKMEKELTKGQGIRDLKVVAKTCNDPDLIKDSMSDLLERQGVSPGLITWMENNPIYSRLISTISKPDPVIPNS